MSRPLALLACLLSLVAVADAQERPAITGVSHIALYAEDMAASDDFYTGTLGLDGAERGEGVRYPLSADQYVEVTPLPQGTDPRLRLAQVGFATDDANALLAYLRAQGVETPDAITDNEDGTLSFSVTDPEGNRVAFVEGGLSELFGMRGAREQMIHVGFIVHDRASMDVFYKDVLGFTDYWAGGVRPGHDEWVSIQVPDGTDWLEYMIVIEPDGEGIPAEMDRRTLGVLNHFALGMADARQTYTTLWRENRLEGEHEVPKIGLDAKWQLNLYDPDGTRTEYMEYAPVGEPCCNPFSGKHPEPPR